jgi:hypothetical protein
MFGAVARGRTVSALLALSTALTVIGMAEPSAAAGAIHHPIGRVTSARFAGGMGVVSGWTLDFDTVAPLRVSITVDGRTRSSVLANLRNPAVARRWPSYHADHGFAVALALTDGAHQVCALAHNVGRGHDDPLGCQTIVGANDPVGAVTDVHVVPGGVRVAGWSLDPNTARAIAVRALVDGAPVAARAAAGSAPLPAPPVAAAHAFALDLPGVAAGSHTVCAQGLNVGLGNTAVLGCRSLTVTDDAVGASAPIVRTSPTTVRVAGWALDPDTNAAAAVSLTATGQAPLTLLANQPGATGDPAIPATWTPWGTQRYFDGQYTVPAAETTICLTAVGVAPGADAALGCQDLPSYGATAPGAPVHPVATTAPTSLTVSWQQPATDGGAHLLGYTATLSPGGAPVALPVTATSATFTKLIPSSSYTVSITAQNSLGTSPAATVTVLLPALPVTVPPQKSPAPVSTSHYLRRLTGDAGTDAPAMRRMGATDAGYNPSGHRYLVMLDIGGQSASGAVLSATTTWLSYASIVTAAEAYVDGYATKQKPNAPMVLALSTNNDMDVTAAAGAAWARLLINPIRTYAAAHHPNITVLGADDMEPGFSATAAQSRAWLTGYLSATNAQFLFNGSADGCAVTRPGSGCNNGWTQKDLQWLAGGAAPSRIVTLPQIYNSAMASQWHQISLTGVAAHLPKVYFGGPLTEWTACSQAQSCSSISNVVAWQLLFDDLRSTSSTAQAAMPYGTDLEIS